MRNGRPRANLARGLIVRAALRGPPGFPDPPGGKEAVCRNIKDKAAFEENINRSIKRYNPEYWRARQSGLEAAQAARREAPARQAER